MLTPEGIEELRQLAGRVLRKEADGGDKRRIREILGELDPAVWDYDGSHVQRMMFFVLGIYNIGRLGYSAAMRDALAENDGSAAAG